MRANTLRRAAVLFPVVVIVVWAMRPAIGQSPISLQPKPGEWRTYGSDLASTHYSPLDQISAANFNKLEVAWRFKTDAQGPRPEYNLESTPLVANGVMYSTAGTRRSVVALDPLTGELLWKYSLNEGKRAEAAPRQLSGRGLSYWTDGREERVIYVTPGYQMVALDAKTGHPVPSFGKNGIVDLKLEDDQQMNLETGDIGLHATPIVAGNTVIVGAAHTPGGTPRSKTNEKGFVRGYDIKTGKRLWIFHTIPRPGEFGNDTWEKDSWSYTGNAGVWGQMTVDEELGYVFIPVEMPTGDTFGGHRPGANLFSDSLVALDLKTGKRVWHYQFIHHDMWDWDIPCAPILATLNVNGRTIKAIAQPTKQAWVYVFDRTNGQPVWPIEERPVEKGTVPTEWYSPTQPFVTKPPAFDRQGVALDDLIDFTPELHAEAVKLAGRYKLGPIFTPPVVSQWEGPLATLMLPTLTGGANWQGASLDPETNIMYVFSNTSIGQAGLIHPPPERSDMLYTAGTAPNPAAPPAGRGRGGAAGGGGRRRGRRRTERAGAAPGETALRTHHRARSEQRRDGVADRARRYAGQHQEQSRAQGPDHSAHRPAGTHRDARDQDAGDRRRGWIRDHAERAGRDASRLRQGDRTRCRCGLHAGAPDRDADHLPRERAPVPDRCHQRTGLQRRVPDVPRRVVKILRGG